MSERQLPPRPGPPFASGRPPAAFLAVALSILGGLHLYVGLRFLGGLAPSVAIPIGALVFGGFVAVAATIAARVSGRVLPSRVAAASLTWLGVVFLGFTVTVVSEPVRWVLPGVSAAGFSGATGLGVLLLSVYGFAIARAPRSPVVRAALARLDPRLDGFRIVQLSDVHIGPTVSAAFVERVVAQANAMDPDIVVITGDLVDGSVAEFGPAAAPLAGLQSRHGVFFVTGNHEYYSGAVHAWLTHLSGLGIRVLRNERVRIERNGAGFDLAGVDDQSGGMAPGHGMDLTRALEGRDPAVPVVLLAHQPTVVRAATAAGVDLQLSGHTHGGQIVPFNLLVSLVQPWMHGLHRVGGTLLYVHRGTGYWGPPLRVGAPGEVALIELVSAFTPLPSPPPHR